MECLQQVRPAQDTQLLPNQVVSEQQSLVLIKKLLAIAVSGITYLRGLFPKKAYGTKHVEDQKVVILREEHSCPGAAEIVQWMQGCFDAIQKKYLRTMVLSIYTDPENPQKVSEVYRFTVQYTSKGAHLEFQSNDNTVSYGDTKKASILLVRKLYTLMQNLGPLPDNVCLNMKLTYYNDVTPQDYQPPGFKNADGDDLEFGREPVKLAVGKVVAPFHVLKLDMATERHRLEEVEESVHEIHEVKRWLLQMEDSVLSQSSVTQEVEEPHNNSHQDASDIKLSCSEEIKTSVQLTEVETLVKDSPHMEVGHKRMRSGRIITSETVCKYEIPNSQETPSSSSQHKKRKSSEPAEPY